MRIFIFSVLVALFVTLPGRVNATPQQSSIHISNMTKADIDPELVVKIIRHLQQSEGLNYERLCKWWCEGKMQITKNSTGYLVGIALAEGTIIISVIDDL